jgi:phage terminase large subunit-like protein
VSEPVTQYANDVLNGKIVAGKLVKLACKRHVNDLKRQGTKNFPYVFDESKAQRIFKYFGYLKHVEGELAAVYPWLDFWMGMQNYR